eukprot:scaffold312333_cov24-Tisochrysis_lutea.AAC.2
MLPALVGAAVLGQLCPAGSLPKGVAFDFEGSTETVNNLGGIAGGSDLICSQTPGVGGPSTACGEGCGCTNPEVVAPPGTPQELRFSNVGQVRQASATASVGADRGDIYVKVGHGVETESRR